MSILDTPFFRLASARLQGLSDRQKTLAENVANVTTPGFTPKDVDMKRFDAELARYLSNAKSGGASAAPHVRVLASPDSETTMDGNSVVLEEQLLKVGETRLAFDTAIGLYQKGLQLVRMATRAPGR